VVRERRERATATARAAAAELESERATAQERVRLARELHDIVAHNLSVVVVQAAGARAQGGADPAALEKIERSGRESLVEMRRLLGVLRSDSTVSTEPQPGIGSLETLADQVRDAGVEVDLRVEGSADDVPAGVDLSAYRIVQESLTNVLKHAGPARVRVDVRCTPGAVDIEVVDDGRGCAPADATTSGHGLLGMRERVALFGGQLQAAAEPSGGFRVSARLPLGRTS
jgi:signal transduction histidine kinase